MTTAKTLLFDLLAVIPDGKRSATFFAEDGVVELPFLHAIGIPTRYQGHIAIREFFNFVGGTLYPDFGFKPQDINVLIETPEQVFAEYTRTRRRHALGVFSITCLQGDLSPRTARSRYSVNRSTLSQRRRR
jgi:hypothetical protein